MPGPKRPRLPFLDWMRGVAAVIMLQGHTFHSFTRNDLRESGPYVLSQFFGGIGPAIFLFLTGITFAFIMDRGERQTLSVRDKLIAALKRARYLLALAFLFRLQLWLFGWPDSPWTDLLKVDVLNCMALTFVVLSPLALISNARRIRWSAILGLLIAVAAPLVSITDWSWLPSWASAYIIPNYNLFAFFPWASFIAFGLSAGAILRSITADQINRVMQWSAISGFALILGGHYFSNLPYSLYPKSEFWLDSPGLIVIKLGVLLVIIAFAYLWAEYVVRDRWSWVKQLGTTSLLVYWVHIEIVYGRWFGAFKESLNNYQVVAFSVCLIAAMLGLSVLRTRTKDLQFSSWTRIPAFRTLTPRRVSGD
jgi:uncharacterized membrane protein